MKTEPQLMEWPAKKFVGVHCTLSLTHNQTYNLWRSFMPRRNEVENRVGNAVYALQQYPPFYFDVFDADTLFEKWAVVEVSQFGAIPHGMETFMLPKGGYAFFEYKGSSTDPSLFTFIFSEWLPASGFVLDQRPHLEILGPAYKNAHPDSEETICIPIKRLG